MKRKRLEQAEEEKIIKEENTLQADIVIEEVVGRGTTLRTEIFLTRLMPIKSSRTYKSGKAM